MTEHPFIRVLRPVLHKMAQRCAARLEGVADAAERERILRDEAATTMDGLCLDLAVADALRELDRLDAHGGDRGQV